MQEYQSIEQTPVVGYGIWVLAILLVFALLGIVVLLTISV